MRVTIWFVLLFAVAVVAASTFGTNDGLASFYWGGWRLDVSLNLFLLVLIGTCFLIVTVIQALNSLVGLPRRAREWRVARRDRSGQAALRDALAQYFGGRYTRAQKSAQRALAIQVETPELAQDNEFTVLGHLLAAGSAHRLQNRDAARRGAAPGAGDRRTQPLGALGRGGRAPARRRVGARRSRCTARPAAARRAAARRRPPHPCAAPQAAGGAPRPPGAGGLEDGAAAGQAPGLLRRRRGRPAALARVRGARHRARLSTSCAASGSASTPPIGATRSSPPGPRPAAMAFGAADDARAWLRPVFDRIADLGAEERATVAETLALAVPGIGAEWLPRLESACAALPRDGGIALAAGCALAERGLWGKARTLLEQAGNDPTLAGRTAPQGLDRPRRTGHARGRHGPRRHRLRGRRPPRLSGTPLVQCPLRAAVAQLDRVLGYEPRGRGFDSCQPHHPLRGATAR